MSESEPISQKKAAELAVSVIAAAGQCLEEKCGKDAAQFYRETVLIMGQKLEESIEWRKKAELKILELASKNKLSTPDINIEWREIKENDKCEVDGYYMIDGSSDNVIVHFHRGNLLIAGGDGCGWNLHIAGPINLPNE